MRQPPTYSPLEWSALRAGAGAVLRGEWGLGLGRGRGRGRGRDDRAALRALLAREFAADGVALFASGTQALQTALVEARDKIGQGRDVTVALPAFTCFDVATAAVGADLRIALYDVDPATLAPDLDSLRKVLAGGGGARIVVVAPLFGLPVDWEAVRACAAETNAVVIEDAAQGSGASWHGRPLGSLGDTSVLSFGRGKGWTGGGGGALLTRRRGAPPAVRNGRDLGAELRVLTLAAAQWAFGRPALYGIPAALPWLGLGETRYRNPEPARALPRAAAGLLLRAVTASQREADQRRQRAEQLREALVRASRVRLIRPLAGGAPGYLRLPILVDGGLDGVANAPLAQRLGAARSYPRPLGELPAVQPRLAGTAAQWPGAVELARKLVTLPTHSLLSARDMDLLARAVAG